MKSDSSPPGSSVYVSSISEVPVNTHAPSDVKACPSLNGSVLRVAVITAVVRSTSAVSMTSDLKTRTTYKENSSIPVPV